MSEQLEDIKHQALTQTSSINAAWPPTPSSHNRRRGFYDEEVLKTPDDVERFSRLFHAEADAAASTNTPEDRFSIRVVGTIGMAALLESKGVTVEAAIPLQRDSVDYALLYTGWNAPGRRLDDETALRHQELIQKATSRKHSSLTPIQILNERGYSPQIVNSSTTSEDRNDLVSRFTGLYSVFDYDTAEVYEILHNPNNTIAYIEHDGEIISTAMAEAGQVTIKDFGSISLVEITEAFTRPDFRGNGLYHGVSGILIQAILDERQRGERTIDALYGESNLNMPGVVFAAHDNGRQFSSADAGKYGIENSHFGILPQNFFIKDGEETRHYNDFGVSYVPLTIQ